MLGLGDEDIELYGKYKAKVSHHVLSRFKDRLYGKLILVTGMTPTPAGDAHSPAESPKVTTRAEFPGLAAAAIV